jgi:hypothetical protein
MRASLAVFNLALGTAYTGYGVLTAIELRRGWRTMGFSHFAAAWIAMAFTCGPHHLAHGIHLAFTGRQPGTLDLVAVVVGLPFGVIWLLLRIEAFSGRGSGDRLISGTPWWVKAFPTMAGVYVTALVAGSLQTLGGRHLSLSPLLAPNVLLFGLYMTIGYFLFRTQLHNRGPLSGWSVSGGSLAVVFPTCAIMHAVFILYAVTGLYGLDSHGLAIDWLSVPAAAYFLWVVRGLHRDSIQDWNRATNDEGRLSEVAV